LYDVQTIGAAGLSSTRAFSVSARPHVVESDPDSRDEIVQDVPLGCVISGCITKGDVDAYSFKAARGDKVVIECWSERIDSALRAVLELRDADGKRLAVNRGFFDADPVVTFAIPADGEYVARLHDLVYSGGESHFYRLDIGQEPRVVFALPPVVQLGKETAVTLYGWNLRPAATETVSVVSRSDERHSQQATGQDRGDAEDFVGSTTTSRLPDTRLGQPLPFETTTVHLTSPEVRCFAPVHRRPAELAVDCFPYYYAGADLPIAIGTTDVPVAVARDNFSAVEAHAVTIPGEVVGQLTQAADCQWYALDALRGEVLYIEAYGERIGSPVDLDVSILDSHGDVELASFHDEIRNLGELGFPSTHLDPAGRWVVPADGRYLIAVRNLIGGTGKDPRRVYRLSVRREEPDVRLVAMAASAAPAGVTLSRGGRSIVDVLALRRRGLHGSVRVSARNLPRGITCPDIWLGPDVVSAPLVFTADEDVEELVTTLDLVGEIEGAGQNRIRSVQSGTLIRAGVPNGSGRLMADLPLAIAGQAPLRITADGHETRDHHLYGKLDVRHSPGGVLDVAVHVHRRKTGHTAAVKLVGVGLPELIDNQTATIPPGEDKGYISFFLPHSLPVGTYTLAIRAETTVPISGKSETQNVVVHSNAVTFRVHPSAFRLNIDLSAPTKIEQGQTLTINYNARRINGFIGKIHTELAAPGKVTDIGRLRGRGVTFVGQTESGTIQVIANEDAELGRQPFLRLYAVGVVEDKPTYHGSCFLNLEIVE
jgi:hypothetical protein